MRKILLIFMLLLPILGMAQSEDAEKYMNKGTKLMDEGKFAEALPYFEKSYSLNKEQHGDTLLPQFAIALCCNGIASNYSEIGSYDKAIKFQMRATDLIKNLRGDKAPLYAISLANLAGYYSDIGNYTEAIRLGTQALEINKKALGKTHPDYATTLNNLAYYNENIGNYDEAIRLCTQALKIRRKALGAAHPDYANSLSNLASYNSDIGNYDEAIRLGTQALEIRRKVLGEAHPDYANSLNNLAGYYSSIGNYTKAIRLCIQALEIYKKALGEKVPIYAISLSNLANYNSDIGNYTEAIRLGTQALEIRGKVLGEAHPDYAASLSNLASIYSEIDNYDEAVRLEIQALEIRRKVLGEEHPNYAASLNNLACYNSSIGNYTEAIRFGTQALEIYKKALGEERTYYTTLLNNLASYNSEIGNYPEAIRLCRQALEIRRRVLGEAHPDYATSLSNLALYNFHLGNYTEAIRFETQALEIRKKALGVDHPYYATSLSNLADYNFSIGNFTEAIRFETQALEISGKALGEAHHAYANSLNDLALYNSSIGNYTEAIRLCNQALEIRRKVLGEAHPDFALSLNNLIGFYFDIDDYNNGSELLNQYYNIVRSNILHFFASMTAAERNNFWTQKKHGLLHKIPKAAIIANNINTSALAYNYLLFSKGLLLNAEIEIQSLITKSGNTNLEERWITLRSNQVKLDKLYQLPLNHRTIKTDSLKTLIERDEKYLMDNIKELGDYTRKLSIECQDVQKHLSPSDVAIEFFIESDTIYALLLKKDFDAPKLIRLSKAAFDEPYSNTAMYKGIWQPLEKYFSTDGNIYFSPSGILHTLAIEHAPINNEEIISDRYKHLYRVSSTRNIALSVAHNTDNTAAIFGGIEYYAEKDTIVKYFADIYRGDNTEDWKELKNTGAEAMSIDTILKQKGFRTEMLTQSAASEENFKRLSGGNYRIMHIATHGYYHADSSAYDNLTNSALVFAGANITKPEDDIDDGLLTAREISRMDLRNTDLVVLSACETALGTVTSEGVFGIQRGFKKAGANTIVMSVKKVYDAATKEFMVEFYQNMVGNRLPKHEAFVSAVHTMRKKYPNDSDKWASFIILDGN